MKADNTPLEGQIGMEGLLLVTLLFVTDVVLCVLRIKPHALK